MNDFTKRRDHHHEKGNHGLANRIDDERRMASGLVKACLKRGYWVSLHNGEDWAIKHSRSYRAVMDALWQTDEEHLYIGTADKRMGWFFLVYGNSGEELICDYADNEFCNAIWEELKPLAAKLAR